MPVPQPGTATAVVSTGTNVCARFGIEGQSVRTVRGNVKPRRCDDPVASRLISSCERITLPSSMPGTLANAGSVRAEIISFAKFAAHTRS